MSSHPESVLDRSSGRAMLELARLAVTKAVTFERLPETIPNEGIFAERRGVFVTLHVRGSLRGCIGVVDNHEPLGEGIVRSAASAALQDPRFAAIRTEELHELQIEVSVLSPLVPIHPERVEIGTHGLLIISGRHRGLLLPQVATEHGLDREQFLDETCRKAGLPRGTWRDADVVLFGFTCDIYSEELGSKAGG
jgi:AmmeMemoRadiSam system protein A